MFGGRTPRKAIQRQIVQRQDVLRRAVDLVEPLEQRKLLTTLTGGETFFYLDAAKQVVRIQLTGDITAEFTAARVRSTNNSVVIRDLIPANPPGVPQAADGADLFNIYVASAAPDAQIIITRVAATNTADRLVTPYAGSVGTIRVTNSGALDDPDNPSGTNNVVTPDGTGAVYIGARTVNITDAIDTEDRIAITRARFNSTLGVRPNTKFIYAGLTTAPDVSLGKVLIAGTITGLVNIEGSIGTFYAGNILTGDVGGLVTPFQPTTTGPVTGKTSIANNFTVGGDLQNLYVSGSIGTTAAGAYRTGTQIRVGGKLGYQHVNNAFGASIQVRNSPSAPSITTPMREVEYVNQPGETDGTSFLQGLLSLGSLVNNSAAGVNNEFAASYGAEQHMSWIGAIQNIRNTDPIDNYSLPLLAGQSAVIKLTSPPLVNGLALLGGGLNLGVFDPLGRFIASDISGVAGSTANEAFQITAKIPGVYTLAVAFANSEILGGGTVTRGTSNYQLDVTGVGNVPFGGSDVSGITRFRDAGNGVAIRTGDLGGWVGRGTVSGTLTNTAFGIPGAPINISRGNIRALYGSSVGVETATFAESLQLTVPNGSVGYIHATGAQGDVAINAQAVDSISGDPIRSEAIGGDYQRVEATRDVDSALVANGGIGTIVAGGINANDINLGFTPIFSANTDGRGTDGNIDTIYVSGNLGGGAGVSGPGLYTGLNGNVKYLHVGGEVFRDQFFGISLQTEQRYPAGRSVRLKDDSGAIAVITPTDVVTRTTTGVTPVPPGGTTTGGTTTITNPDGSTSTVTFDPLTGQTVTTTPGALTITQYGVRGTGGNVIINLASTTSYTVASVGGGGSFDITDTTIGGTGSTVFSDGTDVGFTSGNVAPGATPPIDPITGLPVAVFGRTPSIINQVIYGGVLPINVFNITGSNITSLINGTAGEIVGGNIASLGSVVAESIGSIKSSTNAAVVVPTNLTTSAQPFDAFSRGLQVTGNVISVVARSGIGNVLVGGVVNVVNPNGDARNARGVFDGITGRVQADTINSVAIGEGIAFAGTGTNIATGIYTITRLGNVSGTDADIRGPIVSQQTINSITLNNGSIVNTVVGTLTSFDQATFIPSGYLLPEQANAFSINSININGDGGILGSSILAGRFGAINVSGYGILASNILTNAASGADGSISAGGFGIRFTLINVGGSINSIKATGNGRLLSVSDYNSRVVQTGGPRRRKYDAFSGRTLSFANDLNRMFGTTRATPRISGATNAGVIQDTQIVGNGDLGTLSAYAIASANTVTSLTSLAFPMRVAFSNSIGTIQTTSSVNGLQVRTGSVDLLDVGNNLQRSDIGVAGDITAVQVGGTIRGTSTILAQGGNGVIGSIVVKGGLYGTVNANRSIGTIAANVIGGQIATSRGIGRVLVDLDVLEGSNIRAGRAIDRVIIGRNFEDGAVIDATDIGVFRVGGTNAGDVVTH